MFPLSSMHAFENLTAHTGVDTMMFSTKVTTASAYCTLIGLA